MFHKMILKLLSPLISKKKYDLAEAVESLTEEIINHEKTKAQLITMQNRLTEAVKCHADMALKYAELSEENTALRNKLNYVQGKS